MLLSLSAQYASGQSIRDHCLVHSCAEIRSAPVSGQAFDWQLGPGDCVCVVSCLWMLPRLGWERCLRGGGGRGGYPDINFRCQHGQSWHFIVQQHHYNMVMIWAWVWHLLQDLSNHPPIVGFSTRQSGQISALCLSALIDWMSLLPVECARSSAVSQRRGCQAGAWLEPSGLEGSYHSCQITDSLTPPLPTSSYCFFVSLKHPPDGRITNQEREIEGWDERAEEKDGVKKTQKPRRVLKVLWHVSFVMK